MALPQEWFCALLDSASDVYFRYALVPRPRLAYISPSIRALTGHDPAAFYATADLCLTVVAPEDRRLVRRLLRARRATVLPMRVLRDGVAVPVELRTIAITRRRRLVAIEGVARLLAARPGHSLANIEPVAEPVQQRLASLMFEVHDLLHRVLPAGSRPGAYGASAESPSVLPGAGAGPHAVQQGSPAGRVLRLGALELDRDRLVVTEGGRVVALTPREVMVLRYLLERPSRVVTRQQLLTDVWGYSYLGDDRTVDVHISRLRRKLPSLAAQLVALRGIGYRLDRAA